jgi:hypothetical protein
VTCLGQTATARQAAMASREMECVFLEISHRPRLRGYSKRQSAAALQNVAVFASVHYALASWSAAMLRRFSSEPDRRWD